MILVMINMENKIGNQVLNLQWVYKQSETMSQNLL